MAGIWKNINNKQTRGGVFVALYDTLQMKHKFEDL
jgi:hypothetical protein